MKRIAENQLTSPVEKKAKIATNPGLSFVQSPKAGYFCALRQNVRETDGTLLIVCNPHTVSEILTRQLCIVYKKPLFEIRVNERLSANKSGDDLQHWIKSNRIKRLNIAGNAIHRFPQEVQQQDLDMFVCDLLIAAVCADIKSVHSTGDSGIGEAGIKAAMVLSVPAKVLVPQLWRFHDERGRDQRSEEGFKKRFD